MQHIRFEAPPYAAFDRIEAYAEVDEILRSPDFRQGSHVESAPFFGGSLLLTDGEEHLKRRALISSLFSRGALQYYESEALLPTITNIIGEMRRSQPAGQPLRIDFVPLVRAMLMRITAQVAGADGVDTPERTEEFRALVASLGEAAAVEWSLRDHDTVIREGLRAMEIIVKDYIAPSLEKRRRIVRAERSGELQPGTLPTDLLSLLALHETDAEPFEDAYIWRECVLLLVAASQTTTHALPSVVVHIDEWIAAHPEDREKLTDGEFLRGAIGDSLRLHQPAPALTRIATRDVVLKSGRKIAKDQQVALFFTHANRDPAKFGDTANDFNPYRKLPAGTQPWGLNFGSGVHMCIGRPLVTGQPNKGDPSAATEGTMLKILRMLYTKGMALDPERPPVRITSSVHDAYSAVYVVIPGE